MPELDIDWPLDEMVSIKVTRLAGDIFDIEDIESGQKLRLSWDHKLGSDWDRLLFDGEDIETEAYMSYIGLMDTVVDVLGDKGVGTVLIPKNFGEPTLVEES